MPIRFVKPTKAIGSLFLYTQMNGENERMKSYMYLNISRGSLIALAY